MPRTLLALALMGCSTPSTPTSTDEGATTDRPTGETPTATTADTGAGTGVAEDCTGAPGITVSIDGNSVAYRLSDATTTLFRYTYSGAFDLVGELDPKTPPKNGFSIRFTRWDQPVSSGQRVAFGTTEFPEGDVRTVGLLAASVSGVDLYYNWIDGEEVEGSLDLLCFDEEGQTVTVAWEGFARAISAPTVDVPFSGRITHLPVDVVDVAL